jgi:putative transposase
VIDVLTDAGFSVQRCCAVLGVSSQGYYAYRRRPRSPTKMRREWLTALIAEVHSDSRVPMARSATRSTMR